MNSRRRIAILALALSLVICAAACAARNDDAKALLESAPQASQYPNAGFVNLIDEAKQVIKPDGSWTTTTRVTAKIFNDRGRSIANVHLAYNSVFEKIKILRARTIKKDGTVVEVKQDEVREISPFSGYAMYSSVKAKVMIMPAVENDCIIDYEWQISGRTSIMPNQFWTMWYFQSREPTILSRYTLEVPGNRVVKQGSTNSNVVPTQVFSRDGTTMTYVWEGRDFPEINPEPYMPSYEEIAPWFELTTVGAWQDVASWYWKLVEPQMKSTTEIEQGVRELTKDKTSDAEKAKAIFYWVEDKIRYVGLEFGAGAYEPHSAKDVFTNRYGDCKDQATLLVTMLRCAGIKAWPVLVPTDFKGSTSVRLPSPGVFDHAIAVAEIEGKRIWLDSTAEVCPFGEVPEPDRGCEVLIIKDGVGEFAKIPEYTPDENKSRQTASITLYPTGGIAASVTWSSTGSSDLSARATYKYAKPSRVKESFEGTVTGICPDAKLGNFTVGDPFRRDEPLKVAYDFQAGGWADRTRKFLIFRPSLYQTAMSGTPFSKPDRKYDISFGGRSASVAETEIALPDGFTVEEIPQNVVLKSDFATFERTYELNGKKLKIVEKLVREDAKIGVGRYAEVKKFYEEAIQAQKCQVVLRAAE